MVAPIGPTSGPQAIWPTTFEPVAAIAAKKVQVKETPEQAQYYVTTLQSLKTAQDSLEGDSKIATQKEEKTLWKRFSEWIGSLFGRVPSVQTSELTPEIPQAKGIEPLGPIPKLKDPESIQKQKLAEAIANLNRELATRLKDMADFEKELQESSSKQMDRLIFVKLIACSLEQKTIKQDLNMLSQEEVREKHESNRKLQQAYYSLVDEINKRNQTNSVVKWANIGSTAGIMGAMAINFATGGSLTLAVPFTVPLLSLAKGSLTAAESLLKYFSDKDSGKLFTIGKETKHISNEIRDDISTLQNRDDEVAALYKCIRQHLTNQSDAERIFRKSHTN